MSRSSSQTVPAASCPAAVNRPGLSVSRRRCGAQQKVRAGGRWLRWGKNQPRIALYRLAVRWARPRPGKQRGGAGVQLLQQCQQWLWHRAGRLIPSKASMHRSVGPVQGVRPAQCRSPRAATIGVHRQGSARITQPGHGHVQAGGAGAWRPPGHRPVVAGATGNPDGVRVRCQRPGELRHSQARALHQGVRGQRGSSVALDAWRGRRIKQRVRPMWGDALHGVPVVVGACPGGAVTRCAWGRAASEACASRT